MSNDERPPILGPPVGYVDIFDAALLQKQEEENAKPAARNPLRPSSAGKCARALAYQYNEFKGHATYEPEVKPANVMRILEFGHSVEYHLIQMMRRTNVFEIKYQQQCLTFVKLDDGRLIEGSIDLVVYLPEHRCIMDVKSKGVKYSQGYKSSWDEETAKFEKMETLQKISDQAFYAADLKAFLEELSDPMFADNFYQLNYYACNPFVVERGIDHAAIIRYNKADSRLMEIRFKPDPALSRYVDEKFLGVARAIDGGQGPEAVAKEHMLGSAACAFCRFKKECWPETDPKKAFFSELPPKAWAKDTSYLGQLGIALEAEYRNYVEAEKAKKTLDKSEEKMIKLLSGQGESGNGQKVNKVRFSDGAIYELKFLKSPTARYVFRKGKN
jgi:hypothetical protein